MAGGNLGAISVKYIAFCDVTKGSLTNSRTRYFSTHLLTKGNRSKDFSHFWEVNSQKRHRLLSFADILLNISMYLRLYSFHVLSPVSNPSARGESRPRLPSVTAASKPTATVSCGLALNCAPATVNVYVYQSNAVCLCYMVLWTRRLSEVSGPAESGQRRGEFMVRWVSEKNEKTSFWWHAFFRS